MSFLSSSQSTLASNLLDPLILKEKEEKEPIIGIDLGTKFSCVGIMREGRVEIVPEVNSGNRIIPSIVGFNHDNEKCIGKVASEHILEYIKSIMYDSKRLIGHKFSNENVQNDISHWPIKIIEDKKTGKPQYVIKVDNEERKYFPEEVSSMILEYLKKQAEIYNGNKEIKKAVITVPAHFNNLQRKATIEAANKAGLEVYKLINEPTAAAIAYGDIIKSDKERKVLIFDLGGGTFDVSIVKIKGNEYTVLASQGEEHLGGEDFNQRLFDYVKKEIKKNDIFKNVDFNKKDEIAIFTIQNLMKTIEQVKTELSARKQTSLFIPNLFGINNFKLIIKRTEYEELCKDLFEKCFVKVDETLKFAKLDKKELDEIILVGGSSRTPKIQEMVEKYFGKKPLQNIPVDEVVAYGATLFSNQNNNLIINDITFNNIGIAVKGKLNVIIPKGTILPLRGKNLLKFEKEYIITGENEETTIRIFEGNNEKISDNNFLGEFKIKWNEKIKISMKIDHNSVLNVEAIAITNDKKLNSIKIKIMNK